ncbi:MAG TPA: lipoyl synthase [Proteobacteria bacterium]|nr:lipoyl synthase [Pseudomonadota bacterium]
MPKLPAWLRKRSSFSPEVHELKTVLRAYGLHTVCESARCPNISECFGRKTATFMILGNICTRNCRFCNIESGKPMPPNRSEPDRVADAAEAIGLRFAIVTSVTRDDLPDGGAALFAKTVEALKTRGIDAEVLVPDFTGDERAVAAVVESEPKVFAHNLETVERLYGRVRPQASFARSLSVLSLAKRMNPGMLVKTSLIIGLGETKDEIVDAMRAAKDAGCDIITVGQYLRPNRNCLPVERYWQPEFFAELEMIAREIGFQRVLCGPYVRSSYLAETLVER